jgi:hypothetical protein
MKKTFFLTLLFPLILYSQNRNFKLKTEYGSKNIAVQNLFDYNRAFYYSIKIKGKELKKHNIIILAKNYSDKKLVKTDTVINTAFLENMGLDLLTGNTLNFSVLGQNNLTDSLKINFNFERLTNDKYFKQTVSRNYSMRDGLNSDNKFVKIKSNTKYPILIYTLPYKNPEKPEYLFYCQLTGEDIKPEDWGVHYNIEHYIVFEMEIL